jgi:hypothetical protein
MGRRLLLERERRPRDYCSAAFAQLKDREAVADKQLVLPHKAAAAPAFWDEDEECDDGFDLLQERRVAVADQLEPR